MRQCRNKNRKCEQEIIFPSHAENNETMEYSVLFCAYINKKPSAFHLCLGKMTVHRGKYETLINIKVLEGDLLIILSITV